MAVNDSGPRGTEYRALLLAVLTGAQFLSVLSSLLPVVALPEVGRELGASTTALQWTLDAYMLSTASLLLLTGVLGDRLGHRRLLLAGLALFAVTSLVVGLATSTGWLLAARAAQGLGPAILTPASLAILTRALPDQRDRARAIGLWSAGSGLGMALAPLLGGALADTLGWRWVFLVNVPLSAVLLVLAAVAVPRLEPERSGRRFDLAGAALSVVGVGGLVFALIEGQDRGWGAPLIVAAFAASGCALAALVGWELRRAHPLVDMRLFTRPAFSAAIAAGVVLFFAFVGTNLYFSIYFQQVQGRTAAAAGLALLPVGVGYALAAPLSGRLVGRLGARAPMVAGLALAGVALLWLLRLGVASPAPDTWWALALLGAGSGLSMTPMTATALAAVGWQRAGMASAMLNSTRQIGQALGVALIGAIITMRSGELPAGRMGSVQATAYVSGLHTALWVGAIVVLAAAAFSVAAIPPVLERLRAADG